MTLVNEDRLIAVEPIEPIRLDGVALQVEVMTTPIVPKPPKPPLQLATLVVVCGWTADDARSTITVALSVSTDDGSDRDEASNVRHVDLGGGVSLRLTVMSTPIVPKPPRPWQLASVTLPCDWEFHGQSDGAIRVRLWAKDA